MIRRRLIRFMLWFYPSRIKLHWLKWRAYRSLRKWEKTQLKQMINEIVHEGLVKMRIEDNDVM